MNAAVQPPHRYLILSSWREELSASSIGKLKPKIHPSAESLLNNSSENVSAGLSIRPSFPNSASSPSFKPSSDSSINPGSRQFIRNAHNHVMCFSCARRGIFRGDAASVINELLV
ncbi:hypothetical protein AVEN_169169-1 [Araneus ventricosus]|uniref:Uncharacterized protein n=1 Tax=Araneus ventricosus TaxID=182803 RepID=A0A4Y2KE01_ARAVE|nr:hypothetical protein AVEN_169169-1 [Araneus ventricosus]